MLTRSRSGALLLALALGFSACGSSSSDASDDATNSTEAAETTDTTAADDVTDATEADSGDGETTAAGGEVNLDLFFDGAIEGDVTTEDCTLNGGTETTCYAITIAGYPASHDIGPFCPRSTDDDASAGGIWFDGNEVYDLDGQFFVDLPDTYGDDNWQMYDAEGNIFYTETAEEFDAAARPDVDPDLQNHCVEGQLEFLEGGEAIPSTVLIPVTPVPADSAAAPQGNQGITLDGVVIAESAPVDAILSAYTIAAFDDCGGHFNPFEGYHLHGAVGCSELGESVDGDTPMFGYAMDGYPVHSPMDADNLDACNGHTTEAAGYHYHANEAVDNQVIECLVGQSVANEQGRP